MKSRTADFLRSRRKFEPGLDIRFSEANLEFDFGPGITGPTLEYRSLDSIRQSLRDPKCSGPDPVYAIAMDVARDQDLDELKARILLFGIVTYAAGQLGDEPVRSQGHVHAVSPHCGWSTPELFEIWEGRAIIYGQEHSGDQPGRCVAIEALPGDKVVIPPGWAHCVVNADVTSRLIFGAWCDRQYGFEYTEMRSHHGLAWFPIVGKHNEITWEPNPHYSSSNLASRKARDYPELNISNTLPIYECFRSSPDTVQWVSKPARYEKLWRHFEP